MNGPLLVPQPDLPKALCGHVLVLPSYTPHVCKSLSLVVWSTFVLNFYYFQENMCCLTFADSAGHFWFFKSALQRQGSLGTCIVEMTNYPTHFMNHIFKPLNILILFLFIIIVLIFIFTKNNIPWKKPLQIKSVT